MSAPVNTPTQDSPLLADGFVKNSLTGRLIKVHGGTYQSLVEKGFTLDRESGAMLPPSQSPDMLGHDTLAAEHSNARRKPSRQSTRRRSGVHGVPVRGSGNSSVLALLAALSACTPSFVYIAALLCSHHSIVSPSIVGRQAICTVWAARPKQWVVK